jgi:hypothetical protein
MLPIGNIKPRMMVVCSEGHELGHIDHLSADNRTIKLAKDSRGEHHYIPIAWVTKIEGAVHLDRPLRQATREWSGEAA